MDKLKRKNIFSDSREKSNETPPESHHDFYYEGQNVNDFIEKEEHEEVRVKESKKKLFSAMYNMFF